MDIQSWDFVDPKIAKRLIDLERTRKTIEQQHNSLASNNRLHYDLKTKLIEQTKKVESKVASLLLKEKHDLVDYYDQQIIVTTKSKEQEKLPMLALREDESTVEHSKIMEQLKTSVSTRRVRGASVAPDISVNQFSIKEACGDQLTTRKTKRASIHNGVVVRLKRQLRRQSVFLSRIYHKKKLSVNVKDIINVQEDDQISQVGHFECIQSLDQYRQRQSQTDEYIDLLKKKMQAMADQYKHHQTQLQSQLQQCAVRLGKLADEHDRLEELQVQNETLRMERDELLHLLKRFV